MKGQGTGDLIRHAALRRDTFPKGEGYEADAGREDFVSATACAAEAFETLGKVCREAMGEAEGSARVKQELSPCPFCGCMSVIVEEIPPHKHALATWMPDYPGAAVISCIRDDCGAAVMARDYDTAKARWNRRARG